MSDVHKGGINFATSIENEIYTCGGDLLIKHIKK